MVLNPIKFLLFGNLLFFIMDFQLGVFTTQNIYVPASLLLNIILLFEIKYISKIPKIFLLFFAVSLIGLATSFFELSTKDFLTVIIKFLWILTSGILLNHLISNTSFKLIFFEVSRFAVFTGYFILINLFISFLTIENSYIWNEGFKSLLISADNSKKLSLMILPFFFLSEKRNIFVGCLIFLSLIVGTRALMLASGFILVFSSFYFLKKNSNERFTNKLITAVLILSVVLTAIFVVQNVRTKQLTNIVSLIDRVVIWSQYMNVIGDYPFGLGPEGGFYLVRQNPSRAGLELSSFNEFLLQQEQTTDTATAIDNILDKRIRVNQRLNAKSSESIFIDFVCSFGIMGFCLIITLLFSFFKDLKTAISFKNINFSVLYISFGGTLIYGLFNSFHSGVFFIIFLYVLYYKARSVTIKNGSFNEISNP